MGVCGRGFLWYPLGCFVRRLFFISTTVSTIVQAAIALNDHICLATNPFSAAWGFAVVAFGVTCGNLVVLFVVCFFFSAAIPTIVQATVTLDNNVCLAANPVSAVWKFTVLIFGTRHPLVNFIVFRSF